MNQLSIIYREERSFIKIRRIMLFIFIIDIIIFSGLILKIFYLERSVPLANASTITTSTTSSMANTFTETGLFVDQLKNGGLNVTAVKSINRSPFTVDGQMIMLNGDNIQVFEYPDHDAAMNAASPLVKRYMAKSRPSALRKNIYLYVSDRLVIFYMGNQGDIVSSLDQNAGLSLTNSTPSCNEMSCLSSSLI